MTSPLEQHTISAQRLKPVDPMDFRGQIFGSAIIAQGLYNYKDMLVGTEQRLAFLSGPFKNYETFIKYSLNENCYKSTTLISIKNV